ncbi:hypothetical protein DNTS_022585 [Danionella cerebrum]|uniref:Polyamine-modulated factor 1-binding protein 1 n=1 Tax=Danionella cerebrum TaxID=2873325 RepID=A0A553RDF9_9TELE|nr:hypothetical protein DNTS_022585 [Danionella translucida]
MLLLMMLLGEAKCTEETPSKYEEQMEQLCDLRTEEYKRQLDDQEPQITQNRKHWDGVGQQLDTHNRKEVTVDEVPSREAALQNLDTELPQLKAGLLGAEKQASDTETRLQPLSESLELCKLKYQTYQLKTTHLETSLHSREQALKEAHSQLICLRSQTEALLEALHVQKSQLESGDDVISSLSQQLRETRKELEISRKQSKESKLLISTLKDTAASLHHEVEEQEANLLKTHADFSMYQASHLHANSDYESQRSRVEELEHALFQSQKCCNQSAQELRVCQLELARHQNCNTAVVVDDTQRQKQLNALEMKVSSLEEELQAAQRLCDQEIQKRDALLRQSEADLLLAREEIQNWVAEVERQAISARGLEWNLKRLKKVKRQKDKECTSLKTQLLQLREQLRDANSTLKDTAQKLMLQQEKLQVLEETQHRAHEQLSQRAAELQRAEKTERKLQADLKIVTDCLENTNQEVRDLRKLVELMKAEASSSRQEVLNTQQEAVRLQQEKQQVHEELITNKKSLSTLKTKISRLKLDLDQAQERVRLRVQEAAEADQRDIEMRLELSAANTKQKEQMELLVQYSRDLASQQSQQCCLQRCLIQLTEERADLEEKLQRMRSYLQKERTESNNSQEELQACERRLAELLSHHSRSQLWVHEKDQEVLMLRIEMDVLRENYSSKASEVVALHTQLDALKQKCSAAMFEVEVLQQCLGDARTDNSRLHKESELVVTNVNQWIKEQKLSNEKLSLRLKEQSTQIILLTTQRDNLQENVNSLLKEMGREKTELGTDQGSSHTRSWILSLGDAGGLAKLDTGATLDQASVVPLHLDAGLPPDLDSGGELDLVLEWHRIWKLECCWIWILQQTWTRLLEWHQIWRLE